MNFLNQETAELLNDSTRSISISPDGTTEFGDRKLEMEDVKTIVGGYFQLIHQTKKWTVFANEDGRRLGLATNHNVKFSFGFAVGTILFEPRK